MVNKRPKYGTRIQLWPGGQSMEYLGDIHGPAEQRRLRGSRTAGGALSRWRVGTPAEWRKIRIALHAERIQREEVLCCDSSLVDELAKSEDPGMASQFGIESWRNVYQDPSDWDADACREYLADEGLNMPDIPTLTHDTCEETPCPICPLCVKGEYPDPAADEDDGRFGYLTELRRACERHTQDHPAEVYEWWRVTKWLAEQLYSIGEVIIDNDYGYWWGRTCTGQAMIMDGTLQRVAAEMEREG